jgi:RNA polymerase sigma-70 factor (ECF subfamily)
VLDLALVRAIQAGGPGSRDAWARLLSRYQDRLYAVCLRLVGSSEAAADLAQDSMVKIIQGLDSYDARSKLSTWMIRVAMNTCLSYLRAQRLRKHASLESAELDRPHGALEEGFPGPISSRSTAPNHASHATPVHAPKEQSRELVPEQGVQLEERRRKVSAALSALEPDQRAILVLRDVQGFDYQQIADVLDVAVGTVKSRLFRARLALRNLIEADAPAPAQPRTPSP